MNLYAVRVFKRGVQEGGELYAKAKTALEAMNEVEARLGLKPPRVSVDKSTGDMLVVGWHGHEFRARIVTS